LCYFSLKYIHAAGDHDYGLRAIKYGFKCFISSYKVAICLHNKTGEAQDWRNPSIPLRKRIKDLFSIKGANLRDCLFLVQEDKGILIMLKTFIIYILYVLFPAMFIKQKR